MFNLNESNDSFCLVPWVHTYISPQGVRSLCCISDQSFGKNKTLDDTWNSNEMKDVRLKMLNGEKLFECRRCHDGSNQVNTYRHFFNESYGDLKEDILKNTSEDGTFNQNPVTYDYRTNVCNFKCKTCNEEYSSQIEIEKTINDVGLIKDILNKEERKTSLDIINNEFSNDEILKNIREIYWAGGEPMYWKTHWDTLDKLVEKDYAKNVKLRYHTNLSTIKYKEKNLIDYFQYFKEIEFLCSLDGTGTIGEWIRSNLNYDLWYKNFGEIVNYREKNKNLHIQLTITITIATILDLDNLYELCLEFNVSPEFQTYCSTDTISLLSPKSFPKKIVKKIIDKFLKNHINCDEFIIEKFRNYCDFLLNQEFFDFQLTYDEDFKNAIEKIKYLDDNRPHSSINFETILKQNNELYDFYKKKVL